MKKTTLKIGIFAMAAVLTIASCKKSSSPSTHDKFVGSWKAHQVTYDTDSSGTITSADLVINLDTENLVVKLNGDGTATTTQSGVLNSTFTWELAMSDSYLKITESGTVGYLQIISAPGTSFTVKDTSGSALAWQVFNKQ